MTRSLAGRVVLVTGAARGIGAATARFAAARGARLSLVGLEPDALAALATELGPGHGTVAVTPADALAPTIEVNLLGVVRTVRAALPHVVARRGSILVIALAAAFTVLPGMAAYCASKARAEQFANGLRLELACAGVAVGVAYPSWIDTDLTRDLADDLGAVRTVFARLPGPLAATTAVEACAEALVDGIERRRRRRSTETKTR